jgi:hypothetical protein
VEFRDTAGKQNVFDDGLATTIFPKHTFVVGERVVACLSHHRLLLLETARGYETSKLLNGIAAVADVVTDLSVTSDPTLNNGLLIEHHCQSGL